MSTIQCSQCGKDVATSDSFYTDEAEQVCGACNDLGELAALDDRTTKALRHAGYGALAAGFFGFCCNPGFLVTIFGFSAALGVLSAFPRQEPEWREQNSAVQIAAIIGLIFLILQGAFIVLRLMGVLATFGR